MLAAEHAYTVRSRQLGVALDVNLYACAFLLPPTQCCAMGLPLRDTMNFTLSDSPCTAPSSSNPPRRTTPPTATLRHRSHLCPASKPKPVSMDDGPCDRGQATATAGTRWTHCGHRGPSSWLHRIPRKNREVCLSQVSTESPPALSDSQRSSPTVVSEPLRLAVVPKRCGAAVHRPMPEAIDIGRAFAEFHGSVPLSWVLRTRRRACRGPEEGDQAKADMYGPLVSLICSVRRLFPLEYDSQDIDVARYGVQPTDGEEE